MSTRPSPYPGAQAVSRAVAVLKAFTDARPHLTLAEVARATRLNRATAYRLLAALEHEGLIARASDDGYHLGSEAIVLGGCAPTTSAPPAGQSWSGWRTPPRRRPRWRSWRRQTSSCWTRCSAPT